ncbi:MAG: DsbA family protein, partial [Alistipes sp.]|nr:DsbA family protein [Alistipes sp.]
MNNITIYQFTDPICVWSWGNDAVLRAIEYLYGDKIRIEYVMGGLVEDISTLYDLKGSKLEIVRRSNQIFAENWNAASLRHGMPVATHNFALFSERYPSSFPQNIAYEAAKRLNPQKAKHFLRLLREATFIEGKRTSQIDIIIKEATRAGFCAAKFIDEYTTGSAQTDFMQDRMKCKRNGVTGFPSYTIRNDDTKIFLRGYQNFSTMQALISRLSA